MVTFDGNYHIVESTTTKENRKRPVKKVRKEYCIFTKTLKP